MNTYQRAVEWVMNKLAGGRPVENGTVVVQIRPGIRRSDFHGFILEDRERFLREQENREDLLEHELDKKDNSYSE